MEPSWEIVTGDSLDVLRLLPDACIDSLVTDPPAGIGFMGKEWDSDKGGRESWIKWLSGMMVEALRVMKPGAHGLVWALPRTSHWTATALEDAGFEIRDVITHHFGTGFPKSLDVSKAIDKAAGAERQVVGSKVGQPGRANGSLDDTEGECAITAPATDAAKQWAGWGTALKPGTEHWILVRKPLGANGVHATVAENVQEHGTGALNIDASRIGSSKNVPSTPRRAQQNEAYNDLSHASGETSGFDPNVGRWPANVVFTHSHDCVSPNDKDGGACVEGCPVRELDVQSGESKSTAGVGVRRHGRSAGIMGEVGALRDGRPEGHDDSGGASRFFYCAKPSTSEKEAGTTKGLDGDTKRGNTHPTVKSIGLMSYLVRLISPPGGLVLDPFTGSGTTGIAAVLGGWSFLGIEKSPEFAKIATDRIGHWVALGVSERDGKKAA